MESKAEMNNKEKQSLIKTLQIYAETDKPVTQKFYQGLCLQAIELLESESEECINDKCAEHVQEILQEKIKLQAENKDYKEAMKLYKPCNDAYERKNKQLQEALIEAIALAKELWASVGNHPASRYRYDVAYFEKVLKGE